MSITVNNLFDNDDVEVLWPTPDDPDAAAYGPFKAIAWKRDLSVNFMTAQTAYFASEMDVRRRQLVCDLSVDDVKLQAGAMQMITGAVRAKTDVKGVGDLFRKAVRSTVTEESIVKPVYEGDGLLVCEPTYRHLVCSNLDAWGGAVVLDDGCFLACVSSIEESARRPDSISGLVAGNEGIWKLQLKGSGAFVLETPCPEEELITIDLDDDELRLDGNLALAWSSTLRFTVERVTRTLIGSAVSGEGLVNVYRGTGRVVVTPTQPVTRAGLGD